MEPNLQWIWQTLLGAGLGSIPIAIGVYVALVKQITRQEGRIFVMERDHIKCHGDVVASIKDLENKVDSHRTKDPHITEDYKNLLRERFDAIMANMNDIKKAIIQKEDQA